MPTVRALELPKHLKKSDPAPVYAVIGADEALAARSMRALEQHAAPTELPGSTVRRFEGKAEPADVFGELRTVPFMGMEGRRAVMLEDAEPFMSAHAGALLRYLEAPSRTGSLILRLSKLDARTKVAKAIQKVGVVVDCATVRWRDAEAWVRTRARGLGKKLTQPVARALVEATGTNLIALENELAKLTVYVGQRDAITESDLAEITTNARARSVFDLAESVVKGDAEQALRLCADLLLRGEAKESIVAILAMQLRRYWQVKRLRGSGLDEQGIGRELGMPPFAVRRALPIARRLSDDWFADRLDILSRADHESKTDSLRAGEEQVWVESLLARLCGGKGRAG